MKISASLFVVLIVVLNSIAFAEETQWTSVSIPETWKAPLKGKMAPKKGLSWYRCQVVVPKDWESKEIQLLVEPVDDARQIFFNGTPVGALGTFPPNFRSGLGGKGRFKIPEDLIQFGKPNLISVRSFYEDGRTNFLVAAPALFTSKQGIKMEGNWDYRPGDDAEWSSDDAGILKEMVYSKVDQINNLELYLKRRKFDNDPLSPEEALKRFKTPDDLDVELVLGDSQVQQPLFINFDEKGRMWVLEYLQYPHPAGLKEVSRDKYLRTVYDKVPKAPPHHVRGKDRISIFEDTNNDGNFDKKKIFVDGLNIASSFVKGRGGVWVLNPPYLLFYPDANNDDIPDGDPVVHLSGFGMQDSHSVVNSLRWGPDGWLYAAQGSTVTGDVKRPGLDKTGVKSMGQLIWRYHPELKKYEIFAEGGGNTFGVEIDKHGRIFSGTNGGNARGYYYVQGAYERKGFNKHGSLSNPYAFGYFPAMKHHSVPRFTHNFVIYESGVLPKKYDGKLFGIEPLQGQVVQSHFRNQGATFETEDINRVLKTDDQWFRPVDIKVGPDGAVYVVDMYEQRIDHSSHHAGRIDRKSGRIYRIVPKEKARSKSFDYSKLPSQKLVDVLKHPNKWHRQQALRLIADRKDKSILPLLKSILEKENGQIALEALWAFILTNGITDEEAFWFLDHADPQVRLWTIRLLCDSKNVSRYISKKMAKIAQHESDIHVRCQLACSAKRLPTVDALPIVRNLLTHSEDLDDPFMPLLIWWAIESKAEKDSAEIVKLFSDQEIWKLPIVKTHISNKLIRRFALSGKRKDLLVCAHILNAAPTKEDAKELMAGFEKAYEGRSLAQIPDELIKAIAKTGGASEALKLRQGDPEAVALAIEKLVNPNVADDEKISLIEIFGQITQTEVVPVLISVFQSSKNEDLQSSALVALQSYSDSQIGDFVIKKLNRLKPNVLSVAKTLLTSRKTWASKLLSAVDSSKLDPEFVTLDMARTILLHDDEKLRMLVKKLYGDIAGATTDQMREQIAQLETMLSKGGGNPYKGKKLYMETCGKCHQIFSYGGNIGPSLTSFKRDDVPRMLLSIVNPSAEIREGFENYVALTDEGRVVTGFMADQDNKLIVLRGVDGKNILMPRSKILDLKAIKQSVMPSGLLDKMSEKEIRDLFAFLRISQPLP